MACVLSFFFFQAEDGIRDLYVTGVQTCALPISPLGRGSYARFMDDRATHTSKALRLALVALTIATALPAAAQTPARSTQNLPPFDAAAQSALTPAPSPIAWQYGAFIDVGRLFSSTSPSNHLFRNRGTTPRVDEWNVNMTAAYLKKAPSESSRAGVELTIQEGRDSEIFGFSATAPNIGGADWLLHLGPTNVSY